MKSWSTNSWSLPQKPWSLGLRVAKLHTNVGTYVPYTRILIFEEQKINLFSIIFCIVSLVAICWERAALLAFRLCCFTLCRLNRFCSFPIRCLGQEVGFDCISSRSLPFHQLYNMYLIMMSSWAFKPFGM